MSAPRRIVPLARCKVDFIPSTLLDPVPVSMESVKGQNHVLRIPISIFLVSQEVQLDVLRMGSRHLSNVQI